MSRVTAAFLLGLMTLAMRANADDTWFDASARGLCSVSTSVAESDHGIGVTFGWTRGSGKGPAVVLTPTVKEVARGGSIALVSGSLATPLVLTAEAHYTGRGPQVESLISDIAAGKSWALVLHPPGAAERRVEAHVSNAARVFAMFSACRGFPSRAAVPAAVDGQVRAKGIQNQSFGAACELTALYHWGTNELAIKLRHSDGATVLRVLSSAQNSLAHLDLTSLGGSADVTLTEAPELKLTDVNANLVLQNLVAGQERHMPVRSLIDKPVSLVFGGPEYAIEGAMFKACIDTH